MTKEELKRILETIKANIVYVDNNSIEIDSMSSYGGISFNFDNEGNLIDISSYEQAFGSIFFRLVLPGPPTNTILIQFNS